MARYNKKNHSAYGMAKAAYAKAITVEKELAPENKVYIIDTIPVLITQLGNIYDLVGAGSGYAGIQQGVSVNDRTGDSIKLRRLRVRGIVKRSQAAAIETVRMIIFQGKESYNGLVPTPSYYLQSLDVYSSKNDQNRFASKTLYDQVFTVDDVAKQYHEINLNIPLEWRTQFEPGIPVPSMNGLYMLLMSSTGTVANQPSWEGYFRITYNDA